MTTSKHVFVYIAANLYRYIASSLAVLALSVSLPPIGRATLLGSIAHVHDSFLPLLVPFYYGLTMR